MRTGLVLVVILSVGCATDPNPCEFVSPCPNDRRYTPAQLSACRASLDAIASSACYAQKIAYSNCAGDYVVCRADGTTDPELSQTRYLNGCMTQNSAFGACCMANAGASACR